MIKAGNSHRKKLAAKRKERAKRLRKQSAAAVSGPQAESRGKDPAAILTVEGIQIPFALLGLTKGRFFKSKKKWYLCSRKKQIIAAFSNLDELRSWWQKFQLSQGREPNKLHAINAKTKKSKKRSKKRSKKKGYKQAKTRAMPMRPQSQTSPSAHNPQADRIVWNYEYDMPEF